MTAKGECPSCGKNLSGSLQLKERNSQIEEFSQKSPRRKSQKADEKIPWHLWLLIVAGSIYLGWRLVYGIIALVS